MTALGGAVGMAGGGILAANAVGPGTDDASFVILGGGSIAVGAAHVAVGVPFAIAGAFRPRGERPLEDCEPVSRPVQSLPEPIREAIAEGSDYDAEKIATAARKRQEDSGREGVTLPPRPVSVVKKNAP